LPIPRILNPKSGRFAIKNNPFAARPVDRHGDFSIRPVAGELA
jgi:hypothetical protein